MKFEHLSVAAAIMWEIVASIICTVLLFLILIILAPHTWLWYLSLWLWGAITIAILFIYVPFLYLNSRYAIDDHVIVYKKGVIFPSTQVLYLDRIAFVTVYNNPLTAFIGVSTLSISAAGGNMTIVFLNSKKAQAIAKLLSKKRKH